MTKASRGEITGIQYLRGVAAAMVVLFRLSWQLGLQGHGWSAAAFYAIGMALAAAGGLLCWRFVEQPLTRLAKRLAGGRRAAAMPVSPKD